jgi:single-strand DNA-binding protein
MSGLNKVILIGNLGQDPETRSFDNGRMVANFSLATSETFKNKDGEKETKTEWHRVVLWSPLAEIAKKYLKKGSKAYIEGKIESRSYDDKDGVERHISEIKAYSLLMLGEKDKQPSQGEPEPAKVEGGDIADDLPF